MLYNAIEGRGEGIFPHPPDPPIREKDGAMQMDLIIICGDDAPSGPIRVHPKRRVGGAKGKLHLSAREWQFRLNFYCCLGCLRGVHVHQKNK